LRHHDRRRRGGPRPGDPARPLPSPGSRRPARAARRAPAGPGPPAGAGRGGRVNLPDLPDLSWGDLQLPSVPVPSLPVPDLWGSPAQWMVLLPALAALAGLTLTGRSNRLGAWIGVGGGLATWAAATWQLYTLTRSEDGTRRSGTLGALPLGELEAPLQLLATWPLAWVAWTVATVAVIAQGYAR